MIKESNDNYVCVTCINVIFSSVLFYYSVFKYYMRNGNESMKSKTLLKPDSEILIYEGIKYSWKVYLSSYVHLFTFAYKVLSNGSMQQYIFMEMECIHKMKLWYCIVIIDENVEHIVTAALFEKISKRIL